jgi:probable blue pigment (indigoidine) exporter
VAVVGVALVVLRPGAAFDPIGVLAAIAANIAFALGVVLARRFLAPGNRLAWTGWQLLFSTAMLARLTLIVEGVPALAARAFGGIAYLSLFGTAVAFVLWFGGIRRLPLVAQPLLGLLAPVTGAVLGWVLLGQALAPSQLVGFVVTLSAVAYGAINSQRRDQPPSRTEVVPGHDACLGRMGPRIGWHASRAYRPAGGGRAGRAGRPSPSGGYLNGGFLSEVDPHPA